MGTGEGLERSGGWGTQGCGININHDGVGVYGFCALLSSLVLLH